MKHLKLSFLPLGIILLFSGCTTPDIADGDIDLDTTYFPFGLGYEWCYERHAYYWDIWGTERDEYDTVVIQVEDSIYDSLGWLFDLSGYYYDVGSEARIIEQSPNTLLVPICLNWWWLRDTVFVSLIPSTRTSPIKIEYNSDTLCMSSSCRIEEEFKIYTQSTKRLKRIGTVWQNDAEELLSGKSEGYKKDRLLWFYNSKDTVYKAKD
ncbi:MAG: hypothetical protein E3J71_08910 [Candidatus Stahlbacteria bacterium]|nr:MAG: hypothetical protein E3J71_08910 [Candidatus Stahlbacteria bacterium]